MKPDWTSKTDPEQHPIRFLAALWQQRMTTNFRGMGRPLTPKEFGQLKSLRKDLGDLTHEVVEWMLDPVNWWHFCQQVRSDSVSHHAPPHPHVGYLLAHYKIGLKIMRSKLPNSPAGEDFVRRVDHRHYEQMRNLLLVYAEGLPDRLSKIEAAKTLTDIRRVFIETCGREAQLREHELTNVLVVEIDCTRRNLPPGRWTNGRTKSTPQNFRGRICCNFPV